MRRSKQEICIDILKVLALEGALRFTPLTHKVKVNSHILKDCLNYLCQQGFVEKRSVKNRVVYIATKKGWGVLKGADVFNPQIQTLSTTRKLLVGKAF